MAGEKTSVNLTVLPLMADDESTGKQKKLGTLLMIEDISTEKRMKSTMSRYMDPGIADQLLAGGDEALGGRVSRLRCCFPIFADSPPSRRS